MTGPGFDPEELPRHFSRFYRGKNAGENNFGIGLSLSRQVLAQQNGTVQGGKCPHRRRTVYPAVV